MNKWAIIAAIPTPKSKKIAFKEGVMGSNNSIFVPFAQIIIGNNYEPHSASGKVSTLIDLF